MRRQDDTAVGDALRQRGNDLCRALQALQLGTTEASRYWIYWVPAQYVDAIRDTILGK